MTNCLLSLLTVVTVVSATMAQSPLTTTYLGGHGNGPNTAVYFDLMIAVPVQIDQLDVSALGSFGASSIEFWTCANTWVGNDSNPTVWTQQGSSASVPAMPQNTPTVAPMQPPFPLAPGNYGVAIVYSGTFGPSYSNGNTVNTVWSTAEMTLTAGAAGGIFSGAPFSPRVWNGSIHYTNLGSVTVASRTLYGTGCGARYASFYEHFPTTPAMDLSFLSLLMVPSGSGYAVVAGNAALVTPSATATNLSLGNSTQTTVTLPGAFGYPGGSTNTLNVQANGLVSTASNGIVAMSNPSPGEFLGWPNATWAVWHDFMPGSSTGGDVWFEQIGSTAYITWLNVVGFVNYQPGSVPSTFQFQFDTATGTIAYVFESMDNVTTGGSPVDRGYLIGYSPAGLSIDPGSIDLSGPGLPHPVVGSDVPPLRLTAAARPIQNTTIDLDTHDLGPTVVFGAVAFGFTNPALSLATIGMPGCVQYADHLAVLLYVPAGSSNFALPFTVPSAVGVAVLAQSFAYDPAAALNPLGATASNGLQLSIGDT